MIDHPTQRTTQGPGIVKVWRTIRTTSAFQTHSRTTRRTRLRDPLTLQPMNPNSPYPVCMYMYIYLYIYIYYTRIYSYTAGSTCVNTKERQVRIVKRRKGIEPQRAKHPGLSRATNALIGNEEQNGKKKRTKERNRERSPNPATLHHSICMGFQNATDLQFKNLPDYFKIYLIICNFLIIYLLRG